jgi:UDP-GlcNAc:undecaprenyl-phosphate/decaprenyl-phosphate GlcNAc-1-phosphate transferase
MTTKMVRRLMLAVAGVFLLTIRVSAEEPIVFKTQKDKVDYGIGVNLARNFKQQGIDIDLDLVIKGMRDEFSGQKLLMTEKELGAVMGAFQSEIRQKQVQARRIAAVENKNAGDAFLAENKTKEGVVTLPSGLQYKILRAGDGKKPTEADTVEVRHRGTLINGTEFDNSERSGQPAVTLALKGLVPGLKQALQLMPVGSKWQLFIPYQLAYGQQGSGNIPPNATLIFELELLAIK